MSTIMYMVMVLRPWASVRVGVSPFDDQPLRVDGLGRGFIPVFGDDALICEIGVGLQEEE